MSNMLGQIMIDEGIISTEQLEEAIQAQVVFGGRLGTNLVELGYIGLDQLGSSLSKVHRTPTINQHAIKASSHEVIKALGKKLATKYHCVPISMDKTSISIIMADPSDFKAIDEISFVTGKRVKAHVAPELVILTLMEKYYSIPRPMRYINIGYEKGLKKKEPQTPEHTEAEKSKVEKKQAKPVKPVSKLDFRKFLEEKTEEPDLSQFKDEEPDWSQFEEDEGEAGHIDLVEEAEEEILDIEELILEAPLIELTEDSELLEAEEEFEVIEALPEILTLQEATARLGEVEDRDELSHVVLSFAQSYFKRSALFITRFDRVMGWYGMGGDITPAKVKSIMMPLSEPSIFKTVYDSQAFYLGAVASTPMNDRFLQAMDAEKPQSVFLIPIHFNGQVVNILYGDNGDGERAPFDISELLILAPKVPQAFEQLIRKKKEQAHIA